MKYIRLLHQLSRHSPPQLLSSVSKLLHFKQKPYLFSFKNVKSFTTLTKNDDNYRYVNSIDLVYYKSMMVNSRRPKGDKS